MIVHVVNPNSTVAMTESIAGVARSAAPDFRIFATTAAGTPESIEGYADEAASVPSMLDRIREAEADGADAHVIACFDDPGLDAAREVATGPVIGLCEAAFLAAGRIAKRYSVVTTLPLAVPIIEELALRYGADRGLCRVRAAEVAVLELEYQPETALTRVEAGLRRVATEDGAEAVILGCAGMSAHLERLSRSAGVPVIDGVAFAVRLAGAFVRSGLTTSKIGVYGGSLRKSRPPVSAAAADTGAA